MKRITAIAIAAAAILGSSYVGSASARTPAVNPDLAYGDCVSMVKSEVTNQADVYPLAASCMHGYSHWLFGTDPKEFTDSIEARVATASPANKLTFVAMANFEMRGYLLGRYGLEEAQR